MVGSTAYLGGAASLDLKQAKTLRICSFAPEHKLGVHSRSHIGPCHSQYGYALLVAAVFVIYHTAMLIDFFLCSKIMMSLKSAKNVKEQ